MVFVRVQRAYFAGFGHGTVFNLKYLQATWNLACLDSLLMLIRRFWRLQIPHPWCWGLLYLSYYVTTQETIRSQILNIYTYSSITRMDKSALAK